MPSSTATSAILLRDSERPTKRPGSPGATATAVDGPTPLSISRCLRDAAARLKSAGVESPALDAELLLAHVLEVSRTHLFAHPQRELDAAERARFESLLA